MIGEVFAVTLAALVILAAVVGVLLGFQRVDRGLPFFAVPRLAVRDNHRHSWTKWKVLKEIPIFNYPDPDNGRDLPDRFDSMLYRECKKCGLPQTKTVRGA